MDISLHDLAGGALQEKVNQAFEQVMKNMQEYLEEQLDNLPGFTIIS